MKRKYLKKVVSAALIGTLVVSAVSGCGNSEKESTDSKKTGENRRKQRSMGKSGYRSVCAISGTGNLYTGKRHAGFSEFSGR